MLKKLFAQLIVVIILAAGAFAQTTAFTYQGSLKDGANAANGNYDFEFKLFNLVSGGSQQGSTIQRLNVAVADGIFAVSLDFGAAALPGADRFIEIGVRATGNQGGFQQLLPRQMVASSPYAVKSLLAETANTAATATTATNAANATTATTANNALQLGGVAANQFVQTGDPRLSDSRPPTPGSSNYVQNGTTTQASTNFSISGNGTVGGTLSGNIVNATTQLNIGGNRVLRLGPLDSFFAGVNTGTANTTGGYNSFFGNSTGNFNTTGSNNSFFGNSTGNSNTTGLNNAFFGHSTGFFNSIGGANSFVGNFAGYANSTGNNNSFFGYGSGGTNSTGTNNTIIGWNADVGLNNLTFATAIGADSIVSTSNTIVLGRANGSDTVRIPGQLMATATNSLQLGGVGAAGFVQTNNPALTDDRNPLPNSVNYVQNRTSTQPASNFSVSGTGEANIFNASTQYNFSGFRVLSAAGTRNIFVGQAAGPVNTGISNSFFGYAAGEKNTTGSTNSFFGEQAGGNNISGSDNSFFGSLAGFNNIASGNSFFGNQAGRANTTGISNSFFGESAGKANTTGINNSFYGYRAGMNSTSGSANSFYGYQVATSNTTGHHNAFFGHQTGESNTTSGHNSFFGYQTGRSNTTGWFNAFFGNIAGVGNTTGQYNSFFGHTAGNTNTTGYYNTMVGSFTDVVSNNLSYATAIGAESVVSTSNTIALGRADGSDTVRVPGKLVVLDLGSVGSQPLCRNLSLQISTCSSSLRYKTNINPFYFGLNLINQLRPITFDWKDGGMHDLGLGAEDVAAIEPLLVTYNRDGQVEGVKYDRIGVVLINAVKELQRQSETQQSTIEDQKREIDLLRKLVCLSHQDAEPCKK